MRRKAVVHQQPVKKKPSLTQLAGRHHHHFCSNRDCRLIYEDDCSDPGVNGRCHLCRGVRRPTFYPIRDPQECCIGNCVQVVDTDRLLIHKLAGPGPWFQCKTCARCHGWPG